LAIKKAELKYTLPHFSRDVRKGFREDAQSIKLE
jgi:hypothetical protein